MSSGCPTGSPAEPEPPTPAPAAGPARTRAAIRRGTDRRGFLQLVGGAGLVLALPAWLAACSGERSTAPTTTTPPTTAGPAPPSPPALQPPDGNGLRLPAGFRSRVVATSGEPVGRTDYVWPRSPDGGATFATPDGGWIYVANSEVGERGGAVSMIRFEADGSIAEARAILRDTHRNCSGGRTPWGTWLSCEEVATGRVYECDPTGRADAEVRQAMGVFRHEAVAIDDGAGVAYLTEDEDDGGLYRYTPRRYPDLSEGALDVLVDGGGALRWERVPDPLASDEPCRYQVPDVRPFAGGEGICFLDGCVYVTTSGDGKVHRYDVGDNDLTVVYDPAEADEPVLLGGDNLIPNPGGGLLVAEDSDELKVVVLRGAEPGGDPSGVHAWPVAQLVGVTGTEMTGPAFSPDGSRLYFSSQRNPGRTFEVSGPW